MVKAKPAELLLSLGVLALGIAVAVGTSMLSRAGGLILLGLWLLYEALSGGWRGAAPDQPGARGEHAFSTGAFLWVSAGLIAQMLLIHRAGFVLAQAALFACVARGFGSTRPARDFGIGLGIALGVFLFFVKFLNVNLPAGWLRPLLGGAGI